MQQTSQTLLTKPQQDGFKMQTDEAAKMETSKSISLYVRTKLRAARAGTTRRSCKRSLQGSFCAFDQPTRCQTPSRAIQQSL